MIAGFHAIIPWNQYYADVVASHWVTSIQSELQQTSATIYDYESLIACFSAIKSTSSKIIILLVIRIYNIEIDVDEHLVPSGAQ